MRPDGTEPMTPADLRPGDTVTNHQGTMVTVLSAKTGAYGILIVAEYQDMRVSGYFLFEYPPPDRLISEWRNELGLAWGIIGGRRWPVATFPRHGEAGWQAGDYDDILDAWRAEKASSGDQISAEPNTGVTPAEQT